MDVKFELMLQDAQTMVEGWIGDASEPWFAYQAMIIAALFFVSKLAARRIEPRLEAKARRIKGQPGILRVTIALLRRVDWVLFALLLLAALTVLRASSGPSSSNLVSIAFALALAWLVVSVVSRVVHNRLAARIIRWSAWLYAALVILGIDSDVAQVLDGIALPLGASRISALFVIKTVALLSLAIWLAIVTGNAIERRVQSAADLTPSFRVLIGKIAKITLITFAGAVALSAIGIDLTALTVFSGAVGLGLGFGLQKVVSNFVSGIIILLDKSIKPGDTIELGETFGWVRDLRARFVSVVTRDGREYLIPNEDFISQRVINWSFSDDLVRLDVEFGVGYDCDPHQVSELAIAAAISVARVEADRRPVCWLTGFGESSLDFVLRFWIHDPQQGLTNIRGKVLLALWDAFKDAGVSIPYPVRDVIIRQP